MRLATDLSEDGCPPGELPDDRGFVPWPGDPTAQLERLRSELAGFVARDGFPEERRRLLVPQDRAMTSQTIGRRRRRCGVCEVG